MAIIDAKRRKIGNELIDWIYLGIRTGARQSVAEYLSLKATQPAEALNHLKRAMNMPRRARARINAARDRYVAQGNTVGQFNTFLGTCLTLTGTGVTLAELNTELTALEAQGQSLINRRIAGDPLDDLALWIETNWQNEVEDWQFAFPSGYEDL